MHLVAWRVRRPDRGVGELRRSIARRRPPSGRRPRFSASGFRRRELALGLRALRLRAHDLGLERGESAPASGLGSISKSVCPALHGRAFLEELLLDDAGHPRADLDLLRADGLADVLVRQPARSAAATLTVVTCDGGKPGILAAAACPQRGEHGDERAGEGKRNSADRVGAKGERSWESSWGMSTRGDQRPSCCDATCCCVRLKSTRLHTFMDVCKVVRT